MSTSNLRSRVLVAVIAIPAIVLACYYGGMWFFAFVTGISLLSLHEFYDLALRKGASPQKWIGMTAAFFINVAFFHEQLQFFILPYFIEKGIGISLMTKWQTLFTVLLLSVVIVLLVELFRDKGSVFVNVGYTMLGIFYIGLFAGSLLGLRELYGMEFPYWLIQQHLDLTAGYSDEFVRATTYAWGGMTMISIFATIWMCDTAAYFGGKAMGKHKLFVRVSPNKTWEGAVWGFAIAVVTMLVAQHFFLPYLKFHQAVIIGVIIGTIGQLGDLVESLFKRDAGVKDSSSLIPGHGGVFDRFDSLLFVAPILYLYIDFVVLS